MSRKSPKIASLVQPFAGRELNAYYLAYFDCFNRRLYFEAHEVLEELWLPQRHGPNGPFYKGLIQLAGAFVHLQKCRLRPAAALFKLAQTNLQSYLPIHEALNLVLVVVLIQTWLAKLASACPTPNPLESASTAELLLPSPV